MDNSSFQFMLDPHELSNRITNLANGKQNRTMLDCKPPSPTSSPISSLPAELLSQIFVFCLPDDRYPTPSVTTAPLLPMHVCRLWRNVAQHTPQLWSALHLNYRSSVEDVPVTKLWLNNSRELPLSLSLSIDFNEQPHQAIINELCRHSKRWKHVRFEFRQLSCPPMYDLAGALGNVPMLSTFEFHARDVSTSNIPPVTQLLSSAPMLRELTWNDDVADKETLLALPLSRLARLSLSMNYGKLDYLGLLDQCQNLEHIRITRPYPETDPSQTPLLLPKLTSLNITHDLTGILNYLVLPALKHVRVHSGVDTPDQETRRYSRLAVAHPGMAPATNQNWDPSNLLRLIERSSCHIETLKINTPLTGDNLQRCLKACNRSLQSLAIRGGQSTPTLIDTLMVRAPLHFDTNDGGISCPQLRELAVTTRIPTTCSLVELVQSRMGLASEGGASQTTCEMKPFEALRLHYPAGHKDVGMLRDLAYSSISRKGVPLDLKIVEVRMGNLRGSSAGRMNSHLYRRKVCASR